MPTEQDRVQDPLVDLVVERIEGVSADHAVEIVANVGNADPVAETGRGGVEVGTERMMGTDVDVAVAPRTASAVAVEIARECAVLVLVTVRAGETLLIQTTSNRKRLVAKLLHMNQVTTGLDCRIPTCRDMVLMVRVTPDTMVPTCRQRNSSNNSLQWRKLQQQTLMNMVLWSEKRWQKKTEYTCRSGVLL